MRFRKDARLDASQVSDRRGMRKGPVVVGGGAIGLIFLIIQLLAGGDAPSPTSIDLGAEGTSDLSATCLTGDDANQREDCRIVGVVNSVQSFWTGKLDQYQPAKTVFFTDATQTGCGGATSAVGPFYCPVDHVVYIDLGFYDQLRQKFGAKGGPFGEAYVIAHEYGHHVQSLIGVLDRARSGTTGPESASVNVELMADCFAGMWARGAVNTQYIEELTEADIADGLDAAAAVGDDRIQEKVQGRVDPESWTHGSAAERQRWFKTGYGSETIETCDTFRT